MQKALLIAWKDILLLLRDPLSLVLIFAVPYIVTLGFAFVMGMFTDSSTDENPNQSNSIISTLPISYVNVDEGALSTAFDEFIKSDSLMELYQLTEVESAAAARALVDDENYTAAIIVPDGLSAAAINAAQSDSSPIQIELYRNPARPLTANIIESIVTEFTDGIAASTISSELILTQLSEAGAITFADHAKIAPEISEQVALRPVENPVIALNTSSTRNETPVEAAPETEEDSSNGLAFVGAGIALFFLMYNVTNGSKTIIAERTQGTLPRLMATPSSIVSVLGGKFLGIFIIGLVQITVLILAMKMWGAQWGNPIGVMLVVIATAFAATGWGVLIAAISKSEAQVASIGTSLMLIFGVLSGFFFPIKSGSLMDWISFISPNRWGFRAFTMLSRGDGLGNIMPSVAILLVMALILFGVAILNFRKQEI